MVLPKDSLFRREVMDARRGEWLGLIIVAAPASRSALALLALSIAASVLLFICFGHYTRREMVAGELVPSAGVLNIAAPAAGTVAHIYVLDGQAIKAGDVLLELSSNQDSAALGDTSALVGQQLDAQRDALKADLGNQRMLSLQQTDALREKVALLQEQAQQVSGQLAIQQQLVDSNQQLLDRIRQLSAKGYVSIMQIQGQQSALLNARAEYKAMFRQKLDIQQQLDGVHQQLSQLPLDDATKRGETERQLAAVAQSIAQNELQRAVVLRAPRSGIVSLVLLKEGQMVKAGQQLLSVLPAGSVLQAQLLVPSRAVGFIEPGNRVVLRYEAFPYQKFGQQYGRVMEVSRSSLSPTDVDMLIGQRSMEPLYRVRVELEHQQVLVNGRGQPLMPGMALNADILMERRRLIEWVFEPLFGMTRHLVGEDAHG